MRSRCRRTGIQRFRAMSVLPDSRRSSHFLEVEGHAGGLGRQDARLARYNRAMLKKALAAAAALLLLVFATALLVGARTAARLNAQAPAAQAATRTERTAWYFYRVKWGYQDEFVRLFARNHLPVLREQMKTGRIADVRTYVPTYHGDGRADWTFAVAITFKDTTAMTGPSDEEAIVKRLYPDQATFQKEEQRRFEILDAHWDVPLNELNLAR